MKILISGDSFAADWSVKCDSIGWPNLLAFENAVINVAQAGCGEYKILRQLRSINLNKFDAIIVSHTSPYRIHTMHHPIHCNDELHKGSDFIYSDVKAHNIQSMVDYFEKFFDLDYAKDIHNLICKEINEITSTHNVIHITHFDWEGLFPFKDLINFNDVYKKYPGDANHYSNAGNQIVFEELKKHLS